jgi:tetratricopeptide (TPR) repeat protein
MLKSLQDRKGISSNVKNTLLLLSSIMLIIAYSRPANVQKATLDTEIKKDAAIVLVKQKSSPPALKKAIQTYKEANYSITTYILSSELYLLYPETKSYDFLEDSLSRLSLYEYKKDAPSMSKLKTLEGKYDSLYVVGSSAPLELKEAEKSDFFINIDELYIYPLIAGIVLFFIAVFVPFRFRWGLLILPLVLLPHSTLEAGLLDFYYLDSAYESYEKGEYKEALKSFEKVDKNRAYYNKGNCYYKLGEYEKALGEYQKFEPQTKLERFYKTYNEANALLMLGEKDRAKELYKKALEIKEDRDAILNLGLAEKRESKKPQKREKIPLLKVD